MTAAELHELTRGHQGAGWFRALGLEYHDTYWLLTRDRVIDSYLHADEAADLILAAALRAICLTRRGERQPFLLDELCVTPGGANVSVRDITDLDGDGYQGFGPTLLHATLAALAAVEGGGK